MSEQKIEMLIPCEVVSKPQDNAFSTKASQLQATSNALGGTATQQPDLLYVRSLLVSTGENANDDVFLPEEMWNARHTPVLKPVDWEHETGRELTPSERAKNPKKVIVDNQTIGVMYNAYAIDENGAIIDETKAAADDFEVPRNFHIVDECVIWKALYPTVAAEIEKGAAEGTLFVSMEAWFPDYCYLVGNKVVARNEETAFLDRSLRANGGNGTYGSSRVKRVLRGMTFGGKGIVARPANGPSIIMDVSHEPLSAQASTNKAIANNILFDIGDAKAKDSREDSTMSEKNDKNAVAMDLLAKANEENAILKVQAKEHGDKMEEMKKAKEEAENETARMKGKAEDVQAAFTQGAQLIGQTLEGFAARVEEAGPENFFSVLAEAIGEQVAAHEETKKALSEVHAKIAQEEAAAKAAAREAKVDELLSVEAKGMPPELLEKMKEKQAEKKKKMMAAIDGLNDEQFDALHEVWAAQKAEADEMRRGSLSPEAGADMGRGAQKGDVPQAKASDDVLGKIAELVKASASKEEPKPGRAIAGGMWDAFKVELEKKGLAFDTIEDALKTVGGYKEVSDEESLELLLKSVKASEQAPSAGEEAPVGVDLKSAYAGLANQMFPRDNK